MRFNRQEQQPLEGANLWVNNSINRKIGKTLSTEGSAASEYLDARLNQIAEEVNKHLGCWPSSGLALLFLLSGQNLYVDIYKMPLLPSIERPQSFLCRQPLPCIYHNWLGERRLALTDILGLPRWPSLYVPDVAGTTSIQDPYTLLQSLAFIEDRSVCQKILGHLAKVGSQGWLAWTTPTKLQAVESLFYISRDQRDTPNWWLFDNEASHQLNYVLKCLALCQQQCY